jgi:hypothetical protein
MSTYQYYEFQAIDKPLTAAEKAEIGKQSSRVEVDARKAVFLYNYSDFRGKPAELLKKYFDIHYYIANWGCQRLMFRFPRQAIDPTLFEPYLLENSIELDLDAEWAILRWEIDYEGESFGWIDGEGTLDRLIDLRTEILQQDLRGLYLAWLCAIVQPDDNKIIDYDLPAAPLPAGLNQLSSTQSAFVEIFQVDEHLLTAAQKISPKVGKSVKIDWKKEIGQLTRAECNDYLLRLVTGKANIELELQSRFAPPPDAAITLLGTIQDVLDGQELMEQQAQEHQTALKAQAEQEELDDLAENYEKAWHLIACAIEHYKASGYDEAVVILQGLKKLAIREEQLEIFQERVDLICAQYPSRRGLMERLQKAQIIPRK